MQASDGAVLYKLHGVKDNDYVNATDNELALAMRAGDNGAAAERMKRERTGTTDLDKMKKEYDLKEADSQLHDEIVAYRNELGNE